MRYTRQERAKEIAKKRMEAIGGKVKLRRQTIANLIVPCDGSCYSEECPGRMQKGGCAVRDYTNKCIASQK